MKQLQLYLACHLSAIHTIQSRMFSSLNTYDWVLFVTDKILRDNSLVKNSDIWIVIWRFWHTLNYNWYHGYTEIRYPYYDTYSKQLSYDMVTFATSGNISTKYFGHKFDANKVDGYIMIRIVIHLPPRVVVENSTFLIFDMKKGTMKEVSDNDRMSFGSSFSNFIDADLTHLHTRFTAPFSGPFAIALNRKVTADDINNIDQDMMPGFKLTWNYNKHLVPEDRYTNEDKTKQ